MKKLAVVVILPCLCDLTAASGPEATVAGSWKIVVKQGERSRDYYVELEQAGDRVKGVFVSPRSGRYPFQEGNFREGQLKLTVPRRFENRTFQYVITARLREDGSLAGKLTIDGKASGEVHVSRVFTAVGKWNVTVKSTDGAESYASTLEVTKDKEGKLGGKSKSEMGDFAIRNVKVQGEKFSFDIALEFDGNRVDFAVAATFKDANTMVGRWMAKENQDVSGEWRAKRVPVAAAVKPKAASTQKPAEKPALKNSPLVGRWSGRTETPNGEVVRFTVELEADGDRLSGTMRFGKRPQPIRDVKVRGRRLEFFVDFESEGQTYEVEIEGSLEGKDRMKGRWFADGAEGEWTARRPVVF